MFTVTAPRSLALALIATCAIVTPAFAAKPRIAGHPQTSIQAGAAYEFSPAVSGEGSASARFQIANQPSWLSFNRETGRLRGTPRKSDVGKYVNIVISAQSGRERILLQAFNIVVTMPNRAPTISGNAVAQIESGSVFNFQPRAADPEGAKLTFSVQGKPSWMSFDSSTGCLTGKPIGNQAAVYANIVISVSDGFTSTSLTPFTLTVSRVPGMATVRWAVPTTTENGAPLKNLAGFRVVYGTSSNALDQVLELASPELNSVSVEELDAGTYYFAVKAYTRSGEESELSTVVSKTIL